VRGCTGRRHERRHRRHGRRHRRNDGHGHRRNDERGRRRPVVCSADGFPFVAGETPTSLQLASALGDFASAIASISAREQDPRALPYVNTDTTSYLTRKPEGEWIGLRAHGVSALHGISVTQTALFDERGAFGRVLQSRLVQRGAS
jgi:hypothetical protein